MSNDNGNLHDQVAQSLITKLFPAHTSTALIQMAKNLGPKDGTSTFEALAAVNNARLGLDSSSSESSDYDYRIEDSSSSIVDGRASISRKVGKTRPAQVDLVFSDSWKTDLLNAGKKVATAAANALLSAAHDWLNPKSGVGADPYSVGNKTDASAVGKFSDLALQATPGIIKLASTVVSDYPQYNPKNKTQASSSSSRKGSAPTLYDPIKSQAFITTMEQVAKTTTQNFVKQAQTFLNSNPIPVASNTAMLGSFWDSLKSIATNVAGVASGLAPVIGSLLLPQVQAQQAARLTLNADPSDPKSSASANAITSFAGNHTVLTATTKAYEDVAAGVALRSSQALIDTAQQLHGDYMSKQVGVVDDSGWWNRFAQASDDVGGAIGNFADALQIKNDPSLQYSAPVQGAAIHSSCVATALYCRNHAKQQSTGNLSDDELGSFWDTIKSIAGTVGSVVKTVAPVVTPLLGLL